MTALRSSTFLYHYGGPTVEFYARVDVVNRWKGENGRYSHRPACIVLSLSIPPRQVERLRWCRTRLLRSTEGDRPPSLLSPRAVSRGVLGIFQFGEIFNQTMERINTPWRGVISTANATSHRLSVLGRL